MAMPLAAPAAGLIDVDSARLLNSQLAPDLPQVQLESPIEANVAADANATVKNDSPAAAAAQIFGPLRSAFGANAAKGAPETAKALDQLFTGQKPAADLAVSVDGSPSEKPAAPQLQPAQNTGGGSLSQITLNFLRRFWGIDPLKRGDAFLYAEGVKSLDPALTDAWKDQSQRQFNDRPGSWKKRGTFYRQNGKAFVRLPEDVFPNVRVRPIQVPEIMTQGMLSDTVVEIALSPKGYKDFKRTGRVFDFRDVLALRPIGSYPADMLVGRVFQKGPNLMFGSLFFENGIAKSPYQPMAIEGGSPVKAGDIVQAFIKPNSLGFSAVPLQNLGTQITPEVASREIAFRMGARGYFEKEVIEQAEAAVQTVKAGDAIKKIAAKGRVKDVPCKDFITIDPAGAADLDDAFCIQKEADGGFTWYLATADPALYVRPGTPAFRSEMRKGNTSYTIDKAGISAFPMKHPLISQGEASLLAGKDSVAIVTRMKFGADGKFLIDQAETFFSLINVKGRYSYDHVVDLWNGKPNPIAQPQQVNLARELAAKLNAADLKRGKLVFESNDVDYVKDPATGEWITSEHHDDPVTAESHRLIEELKVYGNLKLETVLKEITEKYGVPHIQRSHPDESELDEKLEQQLAAIGIVWKTGQSLADFLKEIKSRADVPAYLKDAVEYIALRTRAQARYVLVDKDGHQGLALEAGTYGHDSAPIRRFSDMYNITLVQAYLEGGDPRQVYQTIVQDMRSLGFSSIQEYLMHLNGRQQAAKQIKFETADFMSLYELNKPENAGKTFTGYVRRAVRRGEDSEAKIRLEGTTATIAIKGSAALQYRTADRVTVTVRKVDLSRLQLDADIRVADRK